MRGGGSTAYSKIPGSNSGAAAGSTHGTTSHGGTGHGSAGHGSAGHGSANMLPSSTSLLISNPPARGTAASPRPAQNNPMSKWAVLNVFQFCKFLRYVGHVMVLLVLALLGFTYFVVVVQVYAPGVVTGHVGKVLGSTVTILAFSLQTIMVVWSYFACVSTDPGRVPPGWHPFSDEHEAARELERMGYSNYYFDRRDPRRPRFCKRCQAWKPERSHHCSVLGRCVLRMDHYCIWVVNCVGLLNYKAFLMFLMYTCIACATAVALLIKPMIDFFTHSHGEGAPLAFLVVVIDSALCLAIAGFLVMHLQLIASNCTTIEMYEKDRLYPWPYNRGLRRNFEDTFGRNKWRWLLPIHSKEEKRAMQDGCLAGQRLLSTPFASAASV